jgi:O-antigen ligase
MTALPHFSDWRPWKRASPGLLLALTVVGYPLIGLLSALLDLPDGALSIPFRIFVIALSGIILFIYFPHAKIRIDAIFLLLWWSLYSIRLLTDSVNQFPEAAMDAFVFFAATSVVPAIALLMTNVERVNATAPYWIFGLGSLVAGGAVVLEYFDLFGARSLVAATGRLSTDTVNPITLGHVAACAILAAFILPKRRGIAWFLIRATVFVLCVVCIAQTGSKGPVLALIVALSCLALWRDARFLLIGGIASVISIALVVALVPLASSIVDRIAYINEDASTGERLQMYQDAFSQFLSHPLAGSAFLEINSGTYPHNVLLEAFMSTGVVGGLSFIVLSVVGFYKAMQMARGGGFMVPLLFIQAWVAGLFSGSLYGNSYMWVTLALLLQFHAAPSGAVARYSDTFNAGAESPLMHRE